MKRSVTPGKEGSKSANIDVNSMLLFYEAVNAGSINQVSVALKMPKATISRRLRRLEQHVGAVLLKRGAQKLSMTRWINPALASFALQYPSIELVVDGIALSPVRGPTISTTG